MQPNQEAPPPSGGLVETAATTVTQAGRPLPSATTRNGLAARAIPSPDRSGGTAAPASQLSFQTVTPTRISSRGRLTERTLDPRNDSGRAKTPADSCPWRAGSGLPSNAHGFFDGSVRVAHPGPRHRRFQGGRPHPRRPPEHGCQEDCRQGHPLRASGENGPETPLPVPAHARGTQVSNHGVKNFA